MGKRGGRMKPELKRKVHLFQAAFQGRQDIVPLLRKSGYAPLCANEWREGVCQWPKGKCADCTSADYMPLDVEMVADHFRGRHIFGVYPLLPDGTCHFVAGDFDDHGGDQDPLKDVTALFEVCEVNDLTLYVLRSKSGKGFHAYLFFAGPVPAWKARAVMFALIEEAGINARTSSFDRLFPNQDQLTGKGFGNLIALPLQGKAARGGHTLFLDPRTGLMEPVPSQWETLEHLERIEEPHLDRLIQDWDLAKPESGAAVCVNEPGWQDPLLEGVVSTGRHDAALRLAARWRKKGLSDGEIAFFIQAWNMRNHPPKPSLSDPESKELKDILEYVNRNGGRNWSAILSNI